MSSASAPALTITINAETADAAAKMERFFRAFAGNAEALTGMASFLEDFAAKVVTAFSVGAVVEFTKRAIEGEAALERMSQKSGLTVGMLAAMRTEAAKSGLAIEELDAGMAMFADHVFMAVRHGGQLAQVFRDLKVPIVEVNGQLRPTDDILMDVAKKFQAMPAGPQKTAMAIELFGRSGRQFVGMLSATVSDLVTRMKEHGAEVERNAKQAEEFERAIVELRTGFMSIWKDLGNELLPRLKQWAESGKEIIAWLKAVSASSQTVAVLKEIAGALLAVAAARALVNASNSTLLANWLSLSSLTEVRLAIAALITNIRTLSVTSLSAFATAPIIGFTAYLTAATEAILAGVEAWKAWNAAKTEALSAGRVASMNASLVNTARELLDAQLKAKVISAEMAEIYRGQLLRILQMDPKDALTANDRLRGLLRDLQKAVGPKPDGKPESGPLGVSDQDIKLAEAKLLQAQKVEAGFNELAAAENELAYKKREITVEQYFARKRELMNADLEAQRKVLVGEVDLIEKQQADPMNSSNAEKQASLAIQKEEVLTRLGELHNKQKTEGIKLDQEAYEEVQRRSKEQESITLVKAEMELAHIRASRALIESDGLLTDEQKRSQVVPLMDKELAKLHDQIEASKTLRNTANMSELEKTEALRKEQDLQDQILSLEQQRRDMASKTSFTVQFKRSLVELRDEWGSWAQQMATSFKSVFNGAIGSISNGITGLIMQTKTWKQALMDIGTSILTSIVQAIVEMGVRWVATKLMMFLFGKSLEASGVATSTALAAGYSAAWATPATLATIASYGAAADAAPGLIALAEGATMAESVPAMAMGGDVYGGQPYLVGERGPELFVPRDAGMIVPSAQTHSMVGGAGPIHIALVSNDFSAKEYLNKAEGIKHIVRIVGQNKHHFMRIG